VGDRELVGDGDRDEREHDERQRPRAHNPTARATATRSKAGPRCAPGQVPPARGNNRRVSLGRQRRLLLASGRQALRLVNVGARQDVPGGTDFKRSRRPRPVYSGLGPRPPRRACASVPLSGRGNHRCAWPSRVPAVPDCRVGAASLPASRPRHPPFSVSPNVTRRAAAATPQAAGGRAGPEAASARHGP
jgi:hypothetical protein